MKNDPNPQIIVVGAGISGIRCALDMAGSGYRVMLVETAPVLGGVLPQLDRQFPNNHCGMCRLLPMLDRDEGSPFCLKRGLRHDRISVSTSTQVMKLEGGPGSYRVTLLKRSTGIDDTKCNGCMDCADVCPETVPDRFNGGFSQCKAIFMPSPYQRVGTPVIDGDACSQCGACVDVCPSNAISLTADSRKLEFDNIAAIIVATGVRFYHPDQTDLYGQGTLPNVVTQAAFECILSRYGSQPGKSMRPSDGNPARKIAWIQCVGSRNRMVGAEYCSSACCMIAVKEAVFAKEILGESTDTAIFYMDMRTYGRDFQRYRDTAEMEKKVRFVRCRIHSLEPGTAPGDIRLSYIDAEGRLIDEQFEMVVLSTGRDSEHRLPGFLENVTDMRGCFVIDSARQLKDIAESVVLAGAVSARVEGLIRSLGIVPERLTPNGKIAMEKPIISARARVKILLCRCSLFPELPVQWSAIIDELKKLPRDLDIALVDRLCEPDGIQRITETLEGRWANRVLVCACRRYEQNHGTPALRKKTGLPGSFIASVDLRSILLSGGAPESVKAVIARRIEMMTERICARNIQPETRYPVSGSALVVGGGAAGLSAAKTLADCGIWVHLVEKRAVLGGNLSMISDVETREDIGQRIDELKRHPHIKIYTEADIRRSNGTVGRFVTELKLKSGKRRSLEHGVAILATGGRVLSQKDGFPEGGNRVIWHHELARRLEDPHFVKLLPRSVVMIQCHASRLEPYNYCSRICCLQALENAVKLKQMNPATEIYIFYRDIMTPGVSESRYTEARQKGVLFIPYTPADRPEVAIVSGKPVIMGYDPVLREPVRFKPDLISLSTAVGPNDTDHLARMFGIGQTRDGFFREADSKWRPMDTERAGIFICGLARAPVRADTAMAEGEAAAQRALRILDKTCIRPAPITARVRSGLCSLCELCISVCPYQARYFDPSHQRMAVDPAACQGCGACAAACPNGATLLGDFEDRGMLAAIEAAL